MWHDGLAHNCMQFLQHYRQSCDCVFNFWRRLKWLSLSVLLTFSSSTMFFFSFLAPETWWLFHNKTMCFATKSYLCENSEVCCCVWCITEHFNLCACSTCEFFMDPQGYPSWNQLYITKFSHEWLQSCSMLSSGYSLPSHRKDTRLCWSSVQQNLDRCTNAGHCKRVLTSIIIFFAFKV